MRGWPPSWKNDHQSGRTSSSDTVTDKAKIHKRDQT
jgi:hypothetical protein